MITLHGHCGRRGKLDATAVAIKGAESVITSVGPDCGSRSQKKKVRANLTNSVVSDMQWYSEWVELREILIWKSWMS